MYAHTRKHVHIRACCIQAHGRMQTRMMREFSNQTGAACSDSNTGHKGSKRLKGARFCQQESLFLAFVLYGPDRITENRQVSHREQGQRTDAGGPKCINGLIKLLARLAKLDLVDLCIDMQICTDMRIDMSMRADICVGMRVSSIDLHNGIAK